MINGRLACRMALVAILAIPGPHAVIAQEPAAVDHAKRIVDLLRAEKFDDVAKEVNAQMTAAPRSRSYATCGPRCASKLAPSARTLTSVSRRRAAASQQWFSIASSKRPH